jgi:hypothetical protein
MSASLCAWCETPVERPLRLSNAPPARHDPLVMLDFHPECLRALLELLGLPRGRRERRIASVLGVEVVCRRRP